MLREVSLEEISDGKKYGLNDMAKVGCDDCRGCSACCQGMGESIVLDPYDMYRMTAGLGKSPQQLLEESLELHVVDGIILPNLGMKGEAECCSFLGGDGRCTIHPFRPGICRLFPLGRYYEEGSFQYFLQIHECRKENRSKVKVRKWIDTPNAVRYDQYITDWHYFLKDLQEKMQVWAAEANVWEKTAKKVSLYVLQQFYLSAYQSDGGFYDEFYGRMQAAEQWMKTENVQ